MPFCPECGRPLKEGETCDCLEHVNDNPLVGIYLDDGPKFGAGYDPKFGMMTDMVDVSLERCKKLNGNWSTKDKKHKIVFLRKEFKIDDITIYVEAYEDNTLRFVNMYPDKIKFTKIVYSDDTIDVYYGDKKLEFKKDK